MTLSMQKLCYFLKLHHFTIQKIFTYESLCYLVEVLTPIHVNSIMIYIPPEFHFEPMSLSNVYPLSAPIPVPSTFSSPQNISEYYHEIDIHTHIPKVHKSGVDKHLEDMYKKNVHMTTTTENDTKVLQNMSKQLDRLKYSISGMPYRWVILYKKYIGMNTFNDTIDIRSVDHYTSQKHRSLSVMIDLRVFHDKIDSVVSEVNQLVGGLYKVLNGNQSTHLMNIRRLLDSRDSCISTLERLTNVKQQYIDYINKFSTLLEEINVSEANVELELDIVNRTPSTTIHSDIKKNHQKSKLEASHMRLTKTKDKITAALQDMRIKNNDTTLLVDNLLFENIIMLDELFQNMTRLARIE